MLTDQNLTTELGLSAHYTFLSKLNENEEEYIAQFSVITYITYQ